MIKACSCLILTALLALMPCFTMLAESATNPAQLLKLYPQKGCLAAGSDADILILRETDLNIACLLAKGEIVVKDGKAVKKGKYEKE